MTGSTCRQVLALKQNKIQLDGFFGFLVQLAQPLFNLPQNRFNGHGISTRPFTEVANSRAKTIVGSFEKIALSLCERFWGLVAVHLCQNVASRANFMVNSVGLFKPFRLAFTMPV